MRTPVIAGNWKLYKTAGQALELVGGLLPLVAQTKGVEIVVAPVFTVLGKVADALAGSNIHLSARIVFGRKKEPLPAKFRAPC